MSLQTAPAVDLVRPVALAQAPASSSLLGRPVPAERSSRTRGPSVAGADERSWRLRPPLRNSIVVTGRRPTAGVPPEG